MGGPSASLQLSSVRGAQVALTCIISRLFCYSDWIFSISHGVSHKEDNPVLHFLCSHHNITSFFNERKCMHRYLVKKPGLRRLSFHESCKLQVFRWLYYIDLFYKPKNNSSFQKTLQSISSLFSLIDESCGYGGTFQNDQLFGHKPQCHMLLRGGESSCMGHLLPASCFAAATNSSSAWKRHRGSGGEKKNGSLILHDLELILRIIF